MIKTKIVFYLLYLTFVVALTKHERNFEVFGSQKQASVKIAEISEVPQSIDFFTNYVLPRRPVVMKGAAKPSKAYNEWTESSLKKKYGDLIVRLEARDEADEKIPVADLGVGRSTLGYFIDHYQQMNGYVISQIPHQMEEDISIPPCLRCGYFAERFQEAHIFITARGGKTKLHRDPFSNIHCVFNGTKDWIIIEDKYKEFLHQSSSSKFEFGGFSLVNVDRVNLTKFPGLNHINYGRVTLKAGDCIYMPPSYWHQVRVNGVFNVAVSLWFSSYFQTPFEDHDWSNCLMTSFDFFPMNKVKVVWRYKHEIEQGYMDIYVLRMTLLTFVDETGVVDIKKFSKKMITSKHSDITLKMQRLFIETFKKIICKDENCDFVPKEQILDASDQQLKNLLSSIYSNDISNSEDFEYSFIGLFNLMGMINDLLEANQGSIKKENFIANYTSKLGGTKNIASKVFIAISEDQEITQKSFDESTEKLENMFSKYLAHDPTMERRWFKHLKKLGIELR